MPGQAGTEKKSGRALSAGMRSRDSGVLKRVLAREGPGTAMQAPARGWCKEWEGLEGGVLAPPSSWEVGDDQVQAGQSRSWFQALGRGGGVGAGRSCVYFDCSRWGDWQMVVTLEEMWMQIWGERK